MNLRNLSYFLTVTEEMNITKAARRLYLSQQALSNHIVQLEQELGVRLFERSPRLTLTSAGACLRAAALDITNIHKNLLRELNDLQNQCRGELKIGVSFFHSLALMPKILPAYHAAYPLVNVTLVESTAAAMEERLDAGELDLALTLTPLHFSSFETVPIGEEQLILSVPSSVMARRYGENCEERRQRFAAGISLEEFFDEPLIMYDQKEHLHHLVEVFFAARGANPNILMRTRNLHTAFALSRAGLGVTIVPEYFLRSALFSDTHDNKEICYFPLTDPELTATLVVAYHRRRYLSRSAQAMIHAISSTLGHKAQEERT